MRERGLQKWGSDTDEPALASPSGSVVPRRTRGKDESLEGAELESDSGTEEEGGGGSWEIFPKKAPFQEAHKKQERVRGSSPQPRSCLHSCAPAWPSSRKWVTPKLAACLVGTKINLSLPLPSLLSPLSWL